MTDIRQLARNAWDHLLLYLPLTFLGIVAMGTYWMVRSTPGTGTPVAAPVAPGHTPDYFMDGFSIRTFDAAGSVRSEVTGKYARHYADNQWLEIEMIRIRHFDDQGRLTTASADRGLVNEDGSQVQLMGHALVVRDSAPDASGQTAPRLEYRSDFLEAFMNTERVRSNRPVEVVRGNSRFSADRMDYDNVNQVLSLDGRVRGTFNGRASQ